MLKVVCKVCGKKYVNQDFLDKHFVDMHPKLKPSDDLQKGWVTPYGFCDFEQPVSYDEACKVMREAMNEMFNKGGDDATN
jgi:hypothetical protein